MGCDYNIRKILRHLKFATAPPPIAAARVAPPLRLVLALASPLSPPPWQLMMGRGASSEHSGVGDASVPMLVGRLLGQERAVWALAQGSQGAERIHLPPPGGKAKIRDSHFEKAPKCVRHASLQVRYDLLRQQLQMRHFVKHGVEHQVLRPGLGKLVKPIDTLGTTAPDGHTRRHVGIFVPYPEPFA